MKFGDIVENLYTLDTNPIHKTMFMRYSNNLIVCMDFNGRIVKFCYQSQEEKEHYKVVGHIPLKEHLLKESENN